VQRGIFISGANSTTTSTRHHKFVVSTGAP
jgi:hypothetical protein